MENSTYTNRKDEEVEISLYDICASIFRKKLMIVLIVVVAVALAFVYLKFCNPVYESTVTMMVSPLSGGSNSSDLTSLLSGSFSGDAAIETELALLQSRRTVDDALSSLDLSKYTDPDGIPYDQREVPLSAAGILAGDMISVSAVTDTNIVEVSVRDTNAQFAADFANALAEAFNNVLTSFARSGTNASIDFVNSQLPVVQEQAAEAARALADFQRENNVLQATQESQVSLVRYNYLVNRRAPLVLEEGEADAILAVSTLTPGYDELMARSDMQALLTELRKVEEEILSYDLMTVSTAAVSASAQDILTETQQSRYFTLSSRRQTIERQMNDLVVSLLSGTTRQDASLYASTVVQKATSALELSLIDELAAAEDEALSSVPQLEMELAVLRSDVEVYQTMVVSLMTMSQEAQLRAAAVDDNVTLIDEALVPELPVSPNKVMVLAVAFVLGAFIGCGIALLLELNDKSIFSTDDLRKALPPDVPFLGWLPMLRSEKRNRYVKSVVYNNTNSFESEKYKLLASNIIFGRKEQNRVITVCSTDKNEGKTSVMANVALALTQNGYRVLLVDGDLRMPSCEQFFNLEHQERGLVDVVMDGEDLDNCLIQPISDVDSLNLLPCGTRPAVPSLVFSSDNFAPMMAALKRRYDIILFDAPPLEYASELLALTKYAPEVLIVTRAGISNKFVLEELIQSFKNTGAQIIGACLNAVIATHGSGRGGTGYSYYTGTKGAMDSVIKRIPWYSSRKMYYRRRYKRDSRYRDTKRKGTMRKVRPTHPYKPEMDI